MNRFLKDGDPLVSERDVCTPSQIEETVRAFLLGDVTLAQLEGVSAKELYGVADLGYDFLEEGRPDVARRLFEGLCAYNPFDPYFHALLASACRRLGENDRAIRHYRSAVELFPGDIHCWINLGEVLLVEGRRLSDEGDTSAALPLFSEATKAFRKALTLDPAAKNRAVLRARVLGALLADIDRPDR